MDTSAHTMNTLFEQLGLPFHDDDIDTFVDQHKPVPPQLVLSEAGFWTTAQAAFLREAIDSDSDWAELVDQLDTRLRD